MDAQITVTVDTAHLGRIDEVVRQLRAAGMTVDQVFRTTGIVTGSALPSQLPAIRAVRGVQDVEEGVSFQIAPPDADVQ